MKTLACLIVLLVASAVNGQAPLQTVAHDSTLTGDGRSTSPLSVANGGVSTAKLADGSVTSAKIAPGVIPAGPLRVVDSQGTEIGLYEAYAPGLQQDTDAADEFAIHYFPSIDKWGRLALRTEGIAIRVVMLFYESNNCTGTPYLRTSAQSELDFGSAFVLNGFTFDNLAYLGTGPRVTLTIHSSISNNPLDVCQPDGFTSTFRAATSVALPTFTPPFHVTR